MKLQGQVIAENGEGTALVATSRETNCEACPTDDGCACDDLFCVSAANPIGAQKGERVELTLGAGSMWLTVLLVFWLPLILGIGGYYGALAWLESTWAGVVGALLGLALALLAIVAQERRSAKGRGRNYVITRRLG